MNHRLALCGAVVALVSLLAGPPLRAVGRDDPKPADEKKKRPEEPKPFLLVNNVPSEPKVIPKQPTKPDLGIRPLADQPFYLFVHNPSTQEDVDVVVSLKAGPTEPEVKSIKPLKVAAGKTEPIKLPAPAAGAGKPVKLNGPGFAIQLKLETVNDKGKPETVQDWFSVPIHVREATQYVDVRSFTFTPAREGTPNQLVVQVATTETLDPPCKVELVLRPDRLPTLAEAERAASTVRLSKPNEPVDLVARSIPFKPGVNGEGVIYLTVDGYERAITRSTNLGSLGTPFFRELKDASVHVHTPLHYVKPGAEPPLELKVEVDDASAKDATVKDSSVAVGIDRGRDGKPQEEQVFPRERDVQMVFEPIGPEGELRISTTVHDWTWKPDTKGLRGRYALVGWMPDRKNVLPTSTAVTFIDTQPSGVQWVGKPTPKKNGTVHVGVTVGDPVDWIQKVSFFVGKPANGNVPPGTREFPGVRAEDKPAVWTADLPAEGTDPVDLSVVVVNKVGMPTALTTVYKPVPPKAAGTIKGVVKIGDAGQPELDVSYAKGTLKQPDLKWKKVKTDSSGNFIIPDLEPGTYTVGAFKEGSGFVKADHQEVTVDVDEVANVTLNLVQVPKK